VAHQIEIAPQVCYAIGDKLYLNITNRCSCKCVFCVKKYKTGMMGIPLKFEETEPSLDTIIDDLSKISLETYSEIIFCGFGEPFCRFNDLLFLSQWLKKSYPGKPLRINTNGLGDLINKEKTLPGLVPFIDALSVSLNAQNAKIYNLYTKPSFDEDKAYNAVLETIRNAVKLGIQTTATIVYGEELDKIEPFKCELIAQKMGAHFRIRYYSGNT
jgi:TatD DNase family protein